MTDEIVRSPEHIALIKAAHEKRARGEWSKTSLSCRLKWLDLHFGITQRKPKAPPKPAPRSKTSQRLRAAWEAKHK